MHDAACVLIENGKVRFAIEEERLNRIKHTNKLPVRAVRACLEGQGVALREIDLVAYYRVQQYVDIWLKQRYLEDATATGLMSAAAYLQKTYQRGLGEEIDIRKFYFVHHHFAHAMSAFAMSGFENSLVTTFDGEGDGSSGMVFRGEGVTLKPIANFPSHKSLGFFYDKVIAYLGYHLFDEYKVMGLAPYGDPERFRKLFRSFYTLAPNGEYMLHEDRLLSLFESCVPRRKGEPFTQAHIDIAAALQESLEEIAFHVLRHYREKTGMKNLCLAGGVAHNCTLNGKLLRSGLFDNLFVQPAAHDAGGALGAALTAYYKLCPRASKPAQMKHVYWGSEIGAPAAIARGLEKWKDFLQFEKVERITERAAALLAEGKVIGWVQGRSEFGPRALGNRSILADPRPPENKTRINHMIKKREGYRPFAPAVLEECAEEYFEIGFPSERHPFMVFVVNVRKDKRDLLGAVTHVDGTARIQTISKETNPKFWELTHQFGDLTGLPVVLNTSFNNNVEPIVDSIEDAIVTYLTTDLDFLVIGDYLAQKRKVEPRKRLSISLQLRSYVQLHQVKSVPVEKGDRQAPDYYLTTSFNAKPVSSLSAEMGQILMSADHTVSLENLLEIIGCAEGPASESIMEEVLTLWGLRLITVSPWTREQSSSADGGALDPLAVGRP
jgi:carbamoyltransferase